jgi:3-oxoacyl-[acyl-carrier-protein] synthase-3
VKAYIKYYSVYLPEKKLTNEQLAEEFPAFATEAVFEKTGIKVRSVSANGELSSDMCIKAAEELFKNNPIKKTDIDFIIFCTQSADYQCPTTACNIQYRLGLSNDTGAFDVNLGCTGFVYLLSIAKGLIETGQAKNVLLLNAETTTKFLHPLDWGGRVIFSDAATATVVSGREEAGIGDFVFGSDGAKADIMMKKVGGWRYSYWDKPDITPFTDEFGNISSPDNFYMKGPEVFQFAIERVPPMFKKLLERVGKDIDGIDHFMFHQANLYLLQLLRKVLKIPAEKFIIELENFGNTVSCTIPIALEKSLREGRIKKGDNVLLVSFGVGTSWAGTLITI